MANPEVISGLGSRTSVIHAVADADRRGLSGDELRMAQCVGQGATVADVLARCGLPEARAIALLLGLRLRGIINPGLPKGQTRLPDWGAAVRPAWTSGTTPRPPPAPAATSSTPPRPAPAPTPPAPRPAARPAALDDAAVAEQVDLDEARKREILEFEARANGDDLFALLGLAPGADAAEVKKAYYELTRRFHPDRFFGKSLGSFKARIDRVFRRITEAQAVLADPERRRAYLAQHPELAPPPPAPAGPEEQARAAERRSRLARHPYLAKHARFHELVARGRQHLQKNDYAKAYTDLALAAQMDGNNRELQELLQAARRGGDRGRAVQEYNEAVSSETLGDITRALSHFRKAVSLDPDNASYAHHVARLLMNFGHDSDLKEAHLLARRATDLMPDNVEYHLTFARLLVRAGLEKNAIREYETVLRLRPDDPVAKEQLRKLKWKL